MPIRQAVSSDHRLLTDIMRKSKAHWGYSKQQLEDWQDVLTVSSSYIEQNQVYKLLVEQQTVGFYSYFPLEENSVQLDNLFLLPSHIGKGFGKLLMDDFISRAQAVGFQKIKLDSDPNAQAFYLKYGFKVIGQLPTSVPGRFLPIMVKELKS